MVNDIIIASLVLTGFRITSLVVTDLSIINWVVTDTIISLSVSHKLNV